MKTWNPYLGLMIAVLVISRAQAGPEFMQTLNINGLALSGAEYWPYRGTTPFNYPADVLWGFYPKAGIAPEPGEDPNPTTASAAAISCAESAWLKLKAFMESNDAEFQRVVALGRSSLITGKFYLWTNDYSDAAANYPGGLRQARLWYWKRSPQVEGRTPGYWKWESTVTQDGVCQIPSDAQIRQAIRQKLQELGG